MPYAIAFCGIFLLYMFLVTKKCKHPRNLKTAAKEVTYGNNNWLNGLWQNRKKFISDSLPKRRH
jgi:hypothetical protein